MPSKADIIKEIDQTRIDLQHEVAAKYGGILLDLTCKSRRCDGKIGRYWVEVPKLEDQPLEPEVRFVACPKCGVKGNWKVVESPAPNPALVDKAKKEEADEKENARKEEVRRIDEQIAQLRERRNVLEPPNIVEEAEVIAEPIEKA